MAKCVVCKERQAPIGYDVCEFCSLDTFYEQKAMKVREDREDKKSNKMGLLMIFLPITVIIGILVVARLIHAYGG